MRKVVALVILAVFVISPVIASQLIAPVKAEETEAICPYLVATMDVFLPVTTTSSVGHQSYRVIRGVQLTLGVVPHKEKAIAIYSISIPGLHIASAEQMTLEADAEKIRESGVLEFLDPVNEWQIITNGSWYDFATPIYSDGEYYLLYLEAPVTFTVESIILDVDTNHTNGNEVTLVSQVTVNGSYWLPLPYLNITSIYAKFAGYVPVIKIIQNAESVLDTRYTEEDIEVNQYEDITDENETDNLFIGVQDLHEYVMKALESWFGDVITYNVTSFHIEAVMAKELKYETTAALLPYSVMAINLRLPTPPFRKVTITFAKSLDEIKTVISKGVKNVANKYNKIYEVTAINAKKLAKMYLEYERRKWQMVTSVAKNIGQALASAGAKLSDVVTSGAKSIGHFLAAKTKSIVDGFGKVVRGVQTAVGNVVNFGKKVFGIITGFVKTIIKWLPVIIAILVVAAILYFCWPLIVAHLKAKVLGAGFRRFKRF